MSPSTTPPASWSFTGSLGLHGWDHLDAVLLASLALEAPLLLIGRHGTGKSLVAERVAGLLDATLRHYNASLLNYDDLVGIPVPDEAGTGLVYLGTAGAVWDAEFVFLDEINRCRPDLQNKLFPLVHERRLAGEDLPRLRHRWAAINPPVTEDGDAYLGVEELDAALADRFWFVVPVPDWEQLNRRDRTRLVRCGATAADAPDTGGEGQDAAPVVLADLVGSVAAMTATVDALHGDELADYVVTVCDQLHAAEVEVSPRRARLLLQVVCAIHAARLVTGEPEVTLESSAALALEHALPHPATGRAPATTTLVAAHRQAWALTSAAGSEVLRDLLEERDLVERVRLALDHEVDDELLGRLVVQALASLPTEPARTGLAVVLSFALADRDLTPATWGVVVDLARPVLTPQESTTVTAQGDELQRTRAIDAYCADLDGSTESRMVTAYLQGCRQELQKENWRIRLEEFQRWCREFEVDAVTGR